MSEAERGREGRLQILFPSYLESLEFRARGIMANYVSKVPRQEIMSPICETGRGKEFGSENASHQAGKGLDCKN